MIYIYKTIFGKCEGHKNRSGIQKEGRYGYRNQTLP